MSTPSKVCDPPLPEDTIALPTCAAHETYYGPYRLLKKLSAGGMGEVYLARDERLDRKIALKMLPEEFTQNADRVRRFILEAKAASALNHPNIITILDIGETNGNHYIATEYIQGQTLRQLIATPVPIAMALDIGIQISSALNAAHEAGIIHRDIKPENVMLRPDGLVKVLDFGIAKLIADSSLAVSASRNSQETVVLDEYATKGDPLPATPVRMADGTAPGIILGTVSYMSPEQLRGQTVDARSDIFSLGVLLYKMISGTPPFAGETQADRIAAILEHEPAPLADHRPDVPPELEPIISKTLRKDRDFRYQNVKDLLVDLKDLKQDLEFREKLERSAHPDVHDRLQAARARGREPSYLQKVTIAPGRSPWKVQSMTAVVVLALIALALIGASLYWFTQRVVPLSDRDTVVVADFVNTTGDPIFDGTLRQGLAAQLEQSPFLKLLSDERIAQTLSLMTKPADSRLTDQLASEIGQRTGSEATIEGSISGFGSQYELHLKAVDCRNNDVLAEVKATVNGKGQVIAELGKAAAKLREKLGESLASVEKYDAPAENVTTSSLEALQAYSLGYKSHIKGDYVGAIPFFERAASLDPNFAMAYSRMAAALSNMGETERSAQTARKAYELRQRVSERERFYIESLYSNFVTEDFEAGRKINELWAKTYPRDPIPLNRLYGYYSRLGEYEKALSTTQQNLSLDPENGITYQSLTSLYILLNRLDEAKATIREALSKNIDFPRNHYYLYLISFLQNDTAGMEREAALLISKPGLEPIMLQLESETAAHRGQFSRARELVRRAIDSLERAGKNETVSGFQAQAALREAVIGNQALAKRQAEEALGLPGSKYVQAVTALVLGLTGDSAKGTRLADDLAQRYPENTNIQFYHLPMIRAAVAIQSGNAAKAIEALMAAAPYEMGGQRTVNNFDMFPIYLRGQAYLAAHQGTAAAAEFRKILDHPGVVRNQLIGALAHLGLGRSYAIAGDLNHAKTAYQDFLVIWKDADPDIPILKQARAEYRKLNQGA